MDIGNVGFGVAVRDAATGTGYLMWSSEDVHIRFAPRPYIRAADHLVAVVYNRGWHYDNNSRLIPFVPEPDDCLVANLDFTNNTASTLQGQTTTINGIDAGYANGDLQIFPEQFNGRPNVGEFDVTGTVIGD